MKALKHFIYSFVVILLLCGVAEAQTLFGAAHLGSDGPSTFFELNPLTGAAVATGPIGFERCGSMDFSPAGTLFGICERLDGSDTQVLVTINPRTGVGTEVGPLNSCEIFFDMAFRDDGTVFASGFDNVGVVGGPCPFENITLITIDTATGAGTVVGPLVAEPDGIRSGQAGNGLAFRDDGTLFYSAFNFESEPPRPSLYTVNQVTGAATLVTNETFPPGANDIPRTNALDFNPETGALFASIVNGGRGDTINFLGTIDPVSGNVTVIGSTVEGLDAIAFAEVSAPIPTLSEWGLIAMAGILGIVGFMVMRRRNVVA